jgi:ABC-2 type transport system permease protein
MNKHLLVFNLKSNLIMFFSFLGITLMYSTIATAMFDPTTSELMQQFIDALPEAMVNMMGFSNFGTEITGYLATYLYGFIFFIFPMIFIVMLGNKLMAKQIDDSSMAYLLTTPNSRVKVAATQALTLVINVFTLILINVAVIVISAEIGFSGQLQIGKFIGLNFILLGVLTLVSALVFLISTIVGDYSKAVGLSSALVGYLFIMNMIKNLSDDLNFFQYTTFLSLVNIDKVMESNSFIWLSGSLSLISGILVFILSIIIFNKKSLTI